MEYNGFEVKDPKVYLLHKTPLFVGEVAARSAYDSFNKSENEDIKNLNIEKLMENDIDNSDLLYQLSWVYFHESVLEHINFSFYVVDTSRGVLQELVRHRIASYTVRSTRYTMSDVTNSFLASVNFDEFYELIKNLDMLVSKDEEFNELEIRSMWDKLNWYKKHISEEEFIKLAVPKSIIPEFIKVLNDGGGVQEKLTVLNKKTKRNVGDSFKFIVTDNWVVNLVCTINLRSLKNFLTLRNSGGAFWQIRGLSNVMLDKIPYKYKKLVKKDKKDINEKNV